VRLREPHQHAEGRVISARVQVIERVPTVRAIGGSASAASHPHSIATRPREFSAACEQ